MDDYELYYDSDRYVEEEKTDYIPYVDYSNFKESSDDIFSAACKYAFKYDFINSQDCLLTLMVFRNKVLPEETLDIYYDSARIIDEYIKGREDKDEIYKLIYGGIIVPACQLIYDDRLQDAYDLLESAFIKLREAYVPQVGRRYIYYYDKSFKGMHN